MHALWETGGSSISYTELPHDPAILLLGIHSVQTQMTCKSSELDHLTYTTHNKQLHTVALSLRLLSPSDSKLPEVRCHIVLCNPHSSEGIRDDLVCTDF